MLPHSNFEWASKQELDILNEFFRIRSDPEADNVDWDKIWDSNVGFFIEADISFPDDVKKDLANFPPAPHRVTCTHAALSEFSQNLIADSGINYTEGQKLCVTLADRESYVTHHRLMDLYSEIGAKITNVKKALKFEQRPFLKDWVDINTQV